MLLHVGGFGVREPAKGIEFEGFGGDVGLVHGLLIVTQNCGPDKWPGLIRADLERVEAIDDRLLTGNHVPAQLLSMGKEAERRLDDLIVTVERLIETASTGRVPAIKHDLERLAAARKTIELDGTRHPE